MKAPIYCLRCFPLQSSQKDHGDQWFPHTYLKQGKVHVVKHAEGESDCRENLFGNVCFESDLSHLKAVCFPL